MRIIMMNPIVVHITPVYFEMEDLRHLILAVIVVHKTHVIVKNIKFLINISFSNFENWRRLL